MLLPRQGCSRSHPQGRYRQERLLRSVALHEPPRVPAELLSPEFGLLPSIVYSSQCRFGMQSPMENNANCPPFMNFGVVFPGKASKFRRLFGLAGPPPDLALWRRWQKRRIENIRGRWFGLQI